VHLFGQGHEVPRVKAAEMVLQQMEVLDQEVGPSLAIAEQRPDFGERARVDLAALRVIGPAPPSGAGMNAPIVVGR